MTSWAGCPLHAGESIADSATILVGDVLCFLRIVVYSPQIYENYSLQSGEGLSVAFVVVWLL